MNNSNKQIKNKHNNPIKDLKKYLLDKIHNMHLFIMAGLLKVNLQKIRNNLVLIKYQKNFKLEMSNYFLEML